MKKFLLIPFALLQLMGQSALLALGQIWVNKTRSVLTTLGIIIGVSSVSAVIAAMHGMNAKIMENFEIFGTKKIFLWPEQPASGPKKNVDWWQIRFRQEQFEDILEHCPSVEFISFISDTRNTLSRYTDRTVESVRVRGVQASWFKIENRSIVMGRPFSLLDETQGRKVCIISANLRDKLNMDRECVGETIVLGYTNFLVIGLLEDKPAMMFGNMGETQYEVYIPFRTATKGADSWFSVTASCKSAAVAEEAKAELQFFLRRTRHIQPGEPDTFRVFLMENEVQQFKKVMGMITLVAFGIVSISLLVGGIGIMNIMLVSVSERTREIGLRKAVGARPAAILTQFLVEAVVLCLFGGVIGIAIGHLFAWMISRTAPLMQSTQIPAWAVMLSFGFAVAVGVIFGMFPAIKAARLNPIDALRHE
ncbi:MAG: ABC transporter permease [Planctomycetaceae bacterium]|nr:ABC transporter permease [Planctomycetaceae bacterium]